MARRVHDTYSVFVGQLDHSVTKAELHELFKGCGEIADLIIMEDTTGIKKNYGFVRFMDAESALKATEDFHEWPLRGSVLMVDISKDTLAKIQMEKGIVAKKRHTLKENPSLGTTGNNSAKDTMYMNRLKDSLSAMNLQYSSDQRNYNCLLNDMGPLSTICQVPFSRLGEEIPFQEVSDKIMEKCREHGCKSAGVEKAEQFRKALQIIIAEISAVIDIDGINTEKSAKDEDVEKPIFNHQVVPESVRRIQRLEKYSEPVIQQLEKYTEPVIQHIEKDHEPVISELPSNIGNNLPPNVPTKEMCDAECMTDLDQCSVDNHMNISDNNVLDPAILDYHLSPVIPQEQSFRQAVSSDDPLEALYLRDLCGVQRTNSRDSSLSADSIDDSGIETEVDNLRVLPQVNQPEMRYECYRAEGRAEGRARPHDHRTVTPNMTYSNIGVGGLTRRCNEQFSLEEYISQNVGRGRGAGVAAPQAPPRPVGGRGIFKL